MYHMWMLAHGNNQHVGRFWVPKLHTGCSMAGFSANVTQADASGITSIRPQGLDVWLGIRAHLLNHPPSEPLKTRRRLMAPCQTKGNETPSRRTRRFSPRFAAGLSNEFFSRSSFSYVRKIHYSIHGQVLVLLLLGQIL